MSTREVMEALDRKKRALLSPMPLEWRYPPRPVSDPLHAEPDETWLLQRDRPQPLQKNQPHWFHADVVFPPSICGLPLEGTEGRIYIRGWCPFTLWLDGREAFAESHAWHASGPIADPLPMPIQPGTRHWLVLCLTPTEIPWGFNPLAIEVTARACEDMATELSVAVAELDFAEALARTEAERRRVQRAARRVDLDALERDEWSRVRRSIQAMEEALRFLSDRAKAHTVHCLGHAHIDMDWMWTWQDTVHCIRRDFRAVADLMDWHPEVTFAISQVPSYDVVRRMDPDVFRRVRRRIAEGRWENVAGTWVEGDLLMADGETWARHVRYAYAWTREHLGGAARVLWEPDTFGHPANMPQLARLGGFDAYFHMRTNPGRENIWPVREWEGMDGTRVLTVCTYYNGALDPQSIVSTARRSLAWGLRDSLHMWGIGDHGGGLARCELDRLAGFRDRPLMPTIRFSTLSAFAEKVRRQRIRLPRNRGETFHLFEGCWTTHARLKELNRRCESALLDAESLCARAGLDRREALRAAWTPVLFNQFHDLLDGSAVHDAYVDAHRRGEESLRAAETLAAEAVRILIREPSRGRVLTVLNPLGVERTEPVWADLPEDVLALEDNAGREIPVQRVGEQAVFIAAGVPAWGAVSYRMVSRRRRRDTEPVEVSERRDYHEQGDYFRVETDATISRLARHSGVIGGWLDKQSGREFVGYGVPKFLSHTPASRLDLGLNVFQILDESPNAMSAWLIHDLVREEAILHEAEVRLLDQGPVLARFRVRHTFRSSSIEEDVLYWRALNRLDLRARIRWAERGGPRQGVPQLKLAFAASLVAPRVWTEGPFCVTERPADGQEQPTQKWLDVRGDGAGFTLCNDGRYGCDVLGGRARVTLLRNAYSPDPETDNGEHEVRLAFLPHEGHRSFADCVRAGLSFNRPLRACLGEPVEEGPGLRMQGAPNVVCTSIGPSEDGERWLICLFEATGQPARLRLSAGSGIREAETVNFREEPLGGRVSLSRGVVVLGFRPWEVKTLRVRVADRRPAGARRA